MPSPWFDPLVFANVARQRHGRFAAMLGLWAFCPFFALGLVYWQIDVPATISDRTLASMVEGKGTRPQPQRNLPAPLTTDRGRIVATRYDLPGCDEYPTPKLLEAQQHLLDSSGLREQVIQLPQGWQNCNCHGFVFTAGRYWLGGAAVDDIVEDNGYQPVSHAMLGDLALYRDDSGEVTHTGIVCGATSDGMVLIESKWGTLGRFIHGHDRHSFAYGTCTFYRSARTGHWLRGIYPAGREEFPAVSSAGRS